MAFPRDSSLSHCCTGGCWDELDKDCDCDRECSPVGTAVFGGTLTLYGAALFTPLIWANPFDESMCQHSAVVVLSLCVPCVVLSMALCFCLSLFQLNGTCGYMFFVVVSGILVACVFAMILMVLHGACSGDSGIFALSVSLLFLGIPVLVLACGSVHCMCVKLKEKRCQLPPPQQTMQPPAPPRAQLLLKRELMRGNVFLVDMLLDTHGRASNPFWRFRRCLRLALCHCQCRCSCISGAKAKASRPRPDLESGVRSVGRASLDYVHEEDRGNQPIHYLASGATQRTEKRCCFLSCTAPPPEATDHKRAELLRSLHAQGLLDLAALLRRNASGEQPLHCAAASGSDAVAQVLAELAGAAALSACDAAGDTPCELALRRGRLESAARLVGEAGTWPGLSRLASVRSRLELCLEAGALLSEQRSEWRSRVHREQECGGEDAVLRRMARRREELRQRLEVEEGVAEALLGHHSWSVSGAAEAYTADRHAALCAAGLESVALGQAEDSTGTMPMSEQPPLSENEVGHCIVCFEDTTACRLFACGHVTCDSCLRKHLEVRLDEGDASGLICPGQGCKLPVPELVCEELLPEERLARMRSLKAQRFVDSDANSAWCPCARCGCSVSLSGGRDDSGPTVQCCCGTKFCFACGELGGHAPASCEQLRTWRRHVDALKQELDGEKLRETECWIAAHTQSCPGCKNAIQRDGGCNHMICKSCGKHFCYVCGRDWATHQDQPGGVDFYNCKLVPTKERLDVPSNRRDARRLQTFEACFAGWSTNHRELKHHAGMVEALEQLSTTFELPGLLQAIGGIVASCLEARSTLQYCYVLRFSVLDAKWKRALDHQVGTLETVTTALEAACGLSAILSGFESGYDFREPSRFNLRDLVPQLVAAEGALDRIAQLEELVQRRRSGLESRAQREFQSQRDNARMFGVASALSETGAQMKEMLFSRWRSFRL